jgi:hypothetical protein
VREVEPHAVAGQAIERRRRRLTTIRSQRIGAQRVDGNQQNVLTGDGSKVGLGAAASKDPRRDDDRRRRRDDPAEQE